ncbi:hypothetical protein G7046_g4851 [Stylonectria norvegica]|nr:hypothetical protein G7046_g4851 [Stylonectria norvegica]
MMQLGINRSGASPTALGIPPMPYSTASPSGSNNSTTGRPPLWNASSQRKVSRLYLYTTLPITKILEVVHAKSPGAAPGKDSGNKKLSGLLDKEPRWLHPRTESDMGRRLTELSNSPTRSTPDPDDTPLRRHAASDPSPLPDVRSAFKREFGTSPTTFQAPVFPSYTSANLLANLPAPRQRQTSEGHNNGDDSVGHLGQFLRQTTFMSSSTDHSTGSLHRILADYGDGYVKSVKRLMKRYTVPINNRAASMSPTSDIAAQQHPSWLTDDDAPPSLPNKPYTLPGDFLRLDLLIADQAPCFPNAEQHSRRSCLCFARSDILPSPWVSVDGLTYEGQCLLQTGIAGRVNLGARDVFENTVLHFLAARGSLHQLCEAVKLDRCGPILRDTNTAGQTFLHVLSRSHFIDYSSFAQQLSYLLSLLSNMGFDIYARDNYGRNIFHILIAEDMPSNLLNHLLQGCDPAAYKKRDAFNVTPAYQEPIMGINRAYTQAMDLDPPQVQSHFPGNLEPEPDCHAAITEQARLLQFVRWATDGHPNDEDAKGRNGLHCLAVATLGTSNIMSRHATAGLQMLSDQRKAKDLDSSKERLELRLASVKGLIEAGVDLNHYDNNGNTPLMAFVAELPEDDNYKIGPDILKHMIAEGANVNARNRAGETALHIAVRCGRKLAVRALVESGASVHARDAAGRSMLQVTDVKMSNAGDAPRDYAHFEACRAWLSGQGHAVQEPTVAQEWGRVQSRT